MNRGDVSFTFLDRIDEVEQNIADGRWQSALALTLTLPDICGGIAFPDLVKKYRDGRVMLDRKKNPSRDVGGQYIRWFDEYAGDFFKSSPDEETPYICGERCWQLRCEYLHQNKGFLNDAEEDSVRFHLGINCGSSVCQQGKSGGRNGNADIRIDIGQFCQRMCQAAKSYYDAVHQDKDFSLYHTPVLDFVQAKPSKSSGPLIVIVCENAAYAKGLETVCKSISNQILLVSDQKEAEKKLGKKKPAVWIVTDPWESRMEQPWSKEKKTAVIWLTRNPSENQQKGKENFRATLSMPVHPELLRKTVREFLW